MLAQPLILLVDDERAITDNLAPFFERAGFRVSVAHDGDTALRLAAERDPDVIILDVLMPGPDGREVCRRLRQRGDWTPVVMLTQVGGPGERALSLEEGADDYLNKPFDPQELLARVRAVLRRARPGVPPLSAAHILRSGPLTFERPARRALLEGRDLVLTPRAAAVLDYLLTHPDEVITRERLLDAVWGWDYPAGTRAVDARVAELRRALDDDPAAPRFIETVVGQGYRFVGPVEVAS